MKIGSYTYQIGAYFRPMILQKYVLYCIKSCLIKEKWWKQDKVIKEFKITITLKEA